MEDGEFDWTNKQIVSIYNTEGTAEVTVIANSSVTGLLVVKEINVKDILRVNTCLNHIPSNRPNVFLYF